MNGPPANHPSQDDLLLLAAGAAAADQAEMLFRHLADCDTCADRWQAIRSIRADFDGAWDRFEQEIRARRTRPQATPAAAAAGAATATLALHIRGLLDGSRRLVTAAAEGLAATAGAGAAGELRASPVAAYAGVGDATQRAAIGALLADAAELCAAGRDAEALAALGRAAVIDADAGESITIEITTRGRAVGRIVAQARGRRIAVLVDPECRELADAVAVLERPEGSEADARRARVEPVEGADYLLAEFEEVADGPFRIRFESRGE